MKEYKIKILGAQYAANPDYKFGDPETPEMWARTIGMLSNLRDMKPRVVLKAEPTNTNDPLAVKTGEFKDNGKVKALYRKTGTVMI